MKGKVFLLIVALAWFNCSQAQELWHGARTGMTLNEVKSAVSPYSAQDISGPVVHDKKLGDMEAKLWVSYIDLLGDLGPEDYAATLFFTKSQGRLIKVNVYSNHALILNTQEKAAAEYHRVLVALREKYGPERDTKPFVNHLTYVEQSAEWKHDKTHIRLRLLYTKDKYIETFKENLYPITILYQPDFTNNDSL